MKLEDLIQEQYALSEISVLVGEASVTAEMITMESMWIDAPKKGWSYRVDPVDPAIPQKRHIHISKTKNKSSKNMQVAWNDDGTRHDKKSFNSTVGRSKYVRGLASEILNLGPTVTLEHFQKPDCNVTFSEDLKEAYVFL